MSLACRLSNCSSKMANQISSAANNVIFKSKAQKIECSFGCVAHSAVLLKPNVANTLLFNRCEQKFVRPLAIIAIDCNGLSLLIFEEKWPNYASGPKSAANHFGCVGFSMYACGFSVPQMRQFCLLTYPLHLKRWFFVFAIFCKSIADPLSLALFKRIYNHIRLAEG